MGNSVSAQILTLFTAKESRTSAGNELSQATDGPNLHSNRTATTLQAAGQWSLHNSTEDVDRKWV